MKRNVLLTFLAIPFMGFGQYEFYNKGAEVFIQPGALVHVQGTFTNDNGSTNGSIENDGILEVKGDFDNKSSSSFISSGVSNDAVVKFVGSGKQLIKGSMSTIGSSSFYNLIVDQVSSADTVEMQTDATVEGSLMFGSDQAPLTYFPSVASTDNGNHGILKTYDNLSEHILNVADGNVDAIIGYPTLTMNGNPATSFIVTKGSRGSANGGLQRKITNQSSYVFPMGTVENGYNAVNLNFTSVPGGNVSVKGKFCDGTTNPRGYVGTINQSCVGCTPQYPTPDNPGYNRYFPQNPCNANQPQWLILEESGILDHGYWSFDATNNNSGLWKYSIEVFPNSYTLETSPDDTWRTLKFHDSNTDYGTDPSNLTTNWGAQIEDVSTPSDLLTYTRNAGCYHGDGVPGGIYTDFSHFSMHKANSANALPVELISLNADPVNNEYINVSWATALEINNDGFDVLRSTDGTNFSKIAWVDGHDNSSVIQNYALDDHNVTPNVVYYYKLRQVDNDGHSEETYVVSAMITNAETFIISNFIPNPTKDASKINITTSTAQTVSIKMYDILGQIFSDKTYNLSVGSNDINFNANDLADGTYTAIIHTSQKDYAKKLVVTKQ